MFEQSGLQKVYVCNENITALSERFGIYCLIEKCEITEFLTFLLAQEVPLGLT